MSRIPVGLCCWGLTYSLGVEGRTTPRRNPRPMPATDLLDLAARVDLSGVEIAPDIVAPTGAREDLLAFRKHAHELKLSITISGSQAAGPDAVARLMPLFDAAEALGARRVRLTLSAILCGDRRPVGGIDGWRRLLEATVPNLETLAHAAGARGLRLAVENHQDATAEDLVWLCEAVGHPAMGITLDCGNPLAVGQEILPYARHVFPWVANVHLKDYTVHAVDDGFVLARCALGDGVVPFRELLDLFKGQDVALQLELAALSGRRIRVLAPEYWEGLGFDGVPGPDHPMMQVRAKAATGPVIQTPWERTADTELPGYEMMQVERSAAYLAKLNAGA